MKNIMDELNNIEDTITNEERISSSQEDLPKNEERLGRSMTPTISETGSGKIVQTIMQYEHSHSQHFHHTHPPNLQHRVQSMDDTLLGTKDPIRICLVGTVVDDNETLTAAKSFNVPVVTSETGSELIGDNSWTTYFIMKDFEGPIYEAIYKSKHKILGPPALQQAVASGHSLPDKNRPIYNYSMRGVVTCFTGIRQKDVLTRLVNLIHMMGGSIRKDLSSNVTHLICQSASGEKYQYAMTFRLTVVRSDFVFKAWENRDMSNFTAIEEEFTAVHRLRAFEGHRICFFGFNPEDHAHMAGLLKTYGGVDTSLNDPECTHVVMPDNGQIDTQCLLPQNSSNHLQELDNENENPLEIKHESFDGERDCDEHDGDVPTELPMLVEEDENEVYNNEKSSQIPFIDDMSTPKSSKCETQPMETNELDGIVLKNDENNLFLNPNDISPILIGKTDEGSIATIDEEYDNFPNQFDSDFCKRKRVEDDSFDNLSLLSTDSFVDHRSAKKPKLIRTGSITRNLRRSMSFAAIKTPISNMLRTRRSSVDPNASISSITSIDSTFNESIKKRGKEKLRMIRDKITKPGKKDSVSTPKTKILKIASENLGSLKKVCKVKPMIKTPETKTENDSCVGFKTPLAPPYPSTFNTPCSSSQSYKTRSHTITHTQTSSAPSTSSTNTNHITFNTIDRRFVDVVDVGNDNDNDNDEMSLIKKRKTKFSAAINPTKHELNEINVCPDADANPVVDEHIVQSLPDPKNTKTHILKAAWFWFTIQNGYADEKDYLFLDYLDSIANTPGNATEAGERRDSLINYSAKTHRKRKRLSRIALDGTPVSTGKRRSSVSDAGLLSMSGSFIDSTISPDKHDSNKLNEIEPVIETPLKNFSMRRNHFMDFYHTESNYVGILDTIVKLFKEPLEKMTDENPDTALLNKSELKSIFSNFLPIHEVHRKMLNTLQEINSSWHEDCLIGQIILENRDNLIKAYPPYVNFFEQMKETLVLCDQTKPRFHAFLKINQAKPECGRQSLQDLMIRPVQRLPSISLLLNDILKHTSKNNPDHKKLQDALQAIKEVMTYINEDKRKTEGQRAMFDIFNDIECCPPHLISSHRSFISRCEVTELSDILSGRGDSLMLFLFTDTLEICKKRSRVFSNTKSPTNPSTTITSINSSKNSSSTVKPFKHIKLIPLSSIMIVANITDSPRAFALQYRSSNMSQPDQKNKLFSFSISDEEMDKCIYLKNFCKQMAENACRTDSDKFMVNVTSDEVDIDISDVNLGTLSKAFKFATRTRIRVGRAFSFNKTPSKLKRAVSTMMTSPFGSTNTLTPASQLAQMKLQSCTNLNEVGENGSESSVSPTDSEILIAPMTVQPTRKNKNATTTVSIAGLRRI